MSKNIITHGDSRDYLPKMSRKIDCLLTDPPYGVNFKSNRAQTPLGKKFTQALENDGDLDAALELFNDIMEVAVIPQLADTAELYVFTAWHVLDSWMPLLRSYEKPYGIELKQMLIWDKGYPGMGDLVGNWGCGHEVILYLKRGRRPVAHRRSGIIHVDKIPSRQNIHPTEKPVALLRHLIEMSTDPGDLIVDPFSGSGSTSVAAMELGRDSWAFEIDEQYIKRSQNRLKNLGLFA